MNTRKLHRVLGLIFFLFIINVAITGMLRAHARTLYWKDRPVSDKAVLEIPKISNEKVFEVFKSYFDERATIRRIELKPLAGQPVYLVEGESQGKKKILVDASTGEILSPLSQETAARITKLYAGSGQEFTLETMTGFKSRKSAEPRPVWKADFHDSAKTEVYIDQESGDVLSVLDQGKRFGMWVNRLHELDFLGASRWFLLVLGGGFIVLSIAGLLLSFPKKRQAVRNHK